MGGGLNQKRGTQLQRNRVGRGLNLQICGTEGAENFEKMKRSRGNLGLFGVLGEIWPNLDQYGNFALISLQNDIFFRI